MLTSYACAEQTSGMRRPRLAWASWHGSSYSDSRATRVTCRGSALCCPPRVAHTARKARLRLWLLVGSQARSYNRKVSAALAQLSSRLGSTLDSASVEAPSAMIKYSAPEQGYWQWKPGGYCLNMEERRYCDAAPRLLRLLSQNPVDVFC